MTQLTLAGQRVLVTGAAGFLGRHLCARLRADGLEIHAASRIDRAQHDPGLRWWQAPMEDAAAVERLLRDTQPDVLFHLAGLSNGAPGLDLVQPTFHSQLAGTVNVLTAAARSSCRRVIVIGSLEEPTGGPDQDAPASPYGAAKAAATLYARMFHRLYQTPVVVARIYMAYGPGQADDKIIPYTIRSLLEGRAPRLSSGRRALDWIYVDDAVDGLVRASAAGREVDGAILEFGSGESLPIRKVVEEIVAIVQPRVRPMFGALEDRPAAPARAADTAAAGTLLGWRVRTSLAEGLRRTVKSYTDRMAPLSAAERPR